MDKDHTDDKNKENRPNDNPANPLEDLQKQLEKLFGGKPLKFEFAGDPSSISENDSGSERENEDEERALNRIRNFSMKPREIRDYLNRFVIKQDEAKKFWRYQYATTTTIYAAAFKTPTWRTPNMASKIS